jgi:hypothetical protein
MRNRHRVALELDIDEHPAQIEPEAWDLHDLQAALAAGLARPRRMIHGLVLDTERDRLSDTLAAIAEGIEGVVHGYWALSATPRTARPAASGQPRPSIELLVELEAIAGQAQRAARALQDQGI